MRHERREPAEVIRDAFSTREWLPLLTIGALGLLLGLRPLFGAGFGAVPGSALDSRLANYILEHGFRTLVERRPGERFWDPSFFYPVPNVAAYTNVLLGAAPLYWLWRLIGFAPDSSFQLWLLCVVVLNYLTCWWWLRSCVRVGPWAASLGGFMFAFAGVRIAEICHPELQVHFWTMIAIIALFRVVDAPPRRSAGSEGGSEARPADAAASRAAAPIWLAVCFASLSAELYSSFYLGWFTLLGLSLLVAASMLQKEPREAVFRAVALHRVWTIAFVALAGATLVPLGVHYLQAAHEVGLRSYMDEVVHYVPRPQSWLYMGGRSWLYGWMDRFPLWRELPSPHEQAIGLGVLTSLVVAAGFWRERYRVFVVPLVLTWLAVVVLVTSPGGRFTVWRLVAPYVPGAQAIRAVSRASLLLLVPASLGVAFFFDRRRGWIPVALGLACMLEQGGSVAAYDKYVQRDAVARITHELMGRRCGFFYYSPLLELKRDRSRRPPLTLDWFPERQVDAMWTSLVSGVPTVNGFSGNQPSHWEGLEFSAITGSRTEQRIANGLESWIERWKLDPAGLCWIKLPVQLDRGTSDNRS